MTDTQAQANAKYLKRSVREDLLDNSPNARLIFDTFVKAAVLAAGDDDIEYASGHFSDVDGSNFTGFMVAFTPTAVVMIDPIDGPTHYQDSKTANIERPKVHVFPRRSLESIDMVPTRAVFSNSIENAEWLRATLFYPGRSIDLPYGPGTSIDHHDELVSFIPSLMGDIAGGLKAPDRTVDPS